MPHVGVPSDVSTAPPRPPPRPPCGPRMTRVGARASIRRHVTGRCAVRSQARAWVETQRGPDGQSAPAPVAAHRRLRWFPRPSFLRTTGRGRGVAVSLRATDRVTCLFPAPHPTASFSRVDAVKDTRCPEEKIPSRATPGSGASTFCPTRRRHRAGRVADAFSGLGGGFVPLRPPTRSEGLEFNFTVLYETVQYAYAAE